MSQHNNNRHHSNQNADSARQNNQGRNQTKTPSQNSMGRPQHSGQMKTNRGQAIRAQRRTHDMAEKLIEVHNVQEVSEEKRANMLPVSDSKTLRFIPLGGQDGIGEKNMQVIEYGDSAIIIDCGMDLSVDLPGVNFGIPDTSYLEKIKHKIKGYVITHGHLDHIGGLPFILPMYPAPVYGSHFTIGMVKKQLDDAERGVPEGFTPELIEMNMDNHEKLKVGPFFIELVRITHSIPDSSLIMIDTPQGRIINTGDYRLDPEPLDNQPSDITRIKDVCKDGNTLMLLDEGTGANKRGRTPTEHTLEPSFMDVITKAQGRVFIGIFSSNMNRVQMIINAAVASGRKVAIDGRSMLATVELAARLGTLKIPKGTVTTLKSMPKTPDHEVLVICTGGQGELNAALQRMSVGEHQYIKLKEGDTVVISSTPIPGNNVRYDMISDDLTRLGARLFRAPTHELDGCGPLHVSGHGALDEHREMLEMTKPKYYVPMYSGPLHRRYLEENAIENGFDRKDIIQLDAGQSLEFVEGKVYRGPQIPVGTQLVDESGSIVPSVVVKDRLVLSEDGLMTIILTVDRKSGRLLTSPDIITRGFIYMRENEELMNGVRAELRRAASQRFKRVDMDRFKAEIKDHITHYLYEHTGRSPMVIPVVNAIGPGEQVKKQEKPVADN